jgi:hypothetical protein
MPRRPAGYIWQGSAAARKTPIGPVSLNLAQDNISAVDALVLREHLSSGVHNAPEIPWALGHVGGATTGYMFDAAYTGAIARPGTGEVTLAIDANVIGETPDYGGTDVPAASVIANVSDPDIVNGPHTVTAEMVSATSIKLRTFQMTSTMGVPGNAWTLAVREVDVAAHSRAVTPSSSALASHLLKRRRDFLTEAATDWNALVGNQAAVRKTMMVEHASDGSHLVDRVAKAWGWFRPTGAPAYEMTSGDGIAAVTRISAAVVEVEIDTGLDASLDYGACFAQCQLASDDEIMNINGRLHSVTASKSKFRFYLYSFNVAEMKWDRAERPFFAVMFGRPA